MNGLLSRDEARASVPSRGQIIVKRLSGTRPDLPAKLRESLDLLIDRVPRCVY